MPKIKHVCVFCGKEYENYFEDSKYCSKKCYQSYRKENAKLKNHICPNCGNVFDAHDSSVIYCSKKCAGEAQRKRVAVICDNCGKEFDVAKYKADKAARHFCSKECKCKAMFWSKEDEKTLKENYGKMSYGDIAKLLSRDIKPHSIHRKAKTLGLVKPANIWTNEEIQILLNNYSFKPMNEMLKLLPNRSRYAILGQAKKYDLKSYFYLNRQWTGDDTKYLMNNYADKSYEEMSEKLQRTVLAIKIRMYALNLHKPTEIANYNNLYNYVRQRLVPWRNKVREERGYVCELTGSMSNIIVHHTRSFNLLLEECVDMLNFPIFDDFSEYTQEQLDDFVNAFLELQEHYCAYVCITENVHKKFHSIYGYGDNTQEQWDEFVSNYNEQLTHTKRCELR